MGNLPEAQVAPGSPCCSRGFPKGQHQRGSLNLSHSVCSEPPIYLGAVSGVPPPFPGALRKSADPQGSTLDHLGKMLLIALPWLPCAQSLSSGGGGAVGEETAPATLQGPSASVWPLWTSVYSAGKWAWLFLAEVMMGPRPSTPTKAWGWASALGSERTSLPQLKPPF